MTSTTSSTSAKITTLDMAYIGLFAVLIAICSWISVPTIVPFTLQTFAVFLSVGLLGGKRGTLSVIVYVLLGAVGIPVFAGFSGGIGVLIGNTGGYIIGFIFSALLMWALEKIIGKNFWARAIAMILALIVCYAFGSVWFMVVYAKNVGAIGLSAVLGWCVIPFIIPDLIKIALALLLSNQISKAAKL